MYSRRRISCRTRRSRWATRKSPTSVWRRSICSTRRTREPLAAYSLPEVAVAVAAEAAEVVEAAAVAAVAVAVVAPVAELAASRGATAAFAKSLRRLTDALDKRTSKWPGPTMSTRPFHVCLGRRHAHYPRRKQTRRQCLGRVSNLFKKC